MIRYSYLWAREAREGREEGAKDRPCAVVLVLLREGEPEDGLEIPLATKQRLGLDSARSWVVLTEANDFVWPGPDLRAAVRGDPASVVYGMLPPGFMRVLRERLVARWRTVRAKAVPRGE
ncbi:hypothetical protein [Methylocystis iwaonis]|uniref:hypothetical protein n=1 Tax=Methylocystis iwaonis TaxID=2885079 RepID=UPI002E7B06F7|nr:hypothetical protein [Methylocystis iwaonis]